MTDTEQAKVERVAMLGRTMQMQWSTDSGYVMLQFPSDLSAQDVSDMRKLFDLTISGMERRAAITAMEKTNDTA